MYRLLARLGLGQVTCMACARALLPWPFNWESYTYTANGGQSWTWDIACARALTARHAASERMVLDRTELAAWLTGHGHVDEGHLAHIPADRLDEAVMVAPVPDGQGHVLIDGAHRATVRIRSGLPVHGFLLTPVESSVAIDVAPLAIRRIGAGACRSGPAAG
jgi:hypothetical protein